MTTPTTRRFCPDHGDFVLLGDCPILATNEGRNGIERERQGVSDGALGSYDLASALPNPPNAPFGDNGDARRVAATLAPEVGTVLRSKVDGRSRLVLAEPYGRGRPRRLRLPRGGAALPSPADLARDASAIPARACPRCCHPLPLAVDERDIMPVAVAGHTEASKTTTILALMEALEREGPAALGVREFEATKSTTGYLRSAKPEMLAEFRAHLKTRGTAERVRHPALEFLATLPASDTRGEDEVILLLKDAAGEDLMTDDRRLYIVPSIMWSDAILFVYNPEHSPIMRTGEVPNQSVLLNSIREDIERRGQPLPPLVVAISKVDLLDPRPTIRPGPLDPVEADAALLALDDRAMLHAASRWDVTWFYIAPLPGDGGPQQGVTNLFRTLLRLLNS